MTEEEFNNEIQENIERMSREIQEEIDKNVIDHIKQMQLDEAKEKLEDYLAGDTEYAEIMEWYFLEQL